MIGLFIVTHARIGTALLDAAAMIVGPQTLAEAMEVRRDLSPEELRAEMQTRLQRLGADGDGVLIMTDMFGGTPSNLSVGFIADARIEILSGVNLPMVLKFFGSREGADLAELALRLKDYAQQGVTLASELLRQH